VRPEQAIQESMQKVYTALRNINARREDPNISDAEIVSLAATYTASAMHAACGLLAHAITQQAILSGPGSENALVYVFVDELQESLRQSMAHVESTHAINVAKEQSRAS
jgi:hypothetical protein